MKPALQQMMQIVRNINTLYRVWMTLEVAQQNAAYTAIVDDIGDWADHIVENPESHQIRVMAHVIRCEFEKLNGIALPSPAEN